MKDHSPWINLGLVGLAFVLYILIMFATSGEDESATTEPPDPTILRVTADVAADEHAFDLQLTLVVVTDGVTTIGDRAFRDCMALTRVYLPASLESIGMGAFSGCNSLQFIVYDGMVEQWELVAKGTYWADGVLAKEVICSDGVVSLSTNDRNQFTKIWAERSNEIMIQIITERGFGGGYIHKDGDNRILGNSKANPFAPKEYFHYDTNNNLLGHSSPDFGGGYLHFDANRNYIGKSVKNPFGGYVHYDLNGYVAGKSEPAFGGGLVHHDIKLVIFKG